MSKLNEMKSEFNDHKDKLVEQSAKMTEKFVQEMENTIITEEQLQALEMIKENSGIEVDGKDIGDILEELTKSFDVHKMAEPFQEVFKNAEENAVTSFIGLFQVDEDEYSEERILEILKDTMDFLAARFSLDMSDGLTDTMMLKIIKNPCLNELPLDFKKIVFGDVKIVSTDKYVAKMQEALVPMAYLSMKESIDNYIDKQAIEIELYASQEKLLTETKKKMLSDKSVAVDILKDIVASVKESQPNLTVLNADNNIRISYLKNISSLRILAELCENVELPEDTANAEQMKAKMAEQAQVYKAKAAMLQRIIDLEFTKPLGIYYESLKNHKSLKLEAEMTKQLDLYIQRVAKYKFSIPMPGFKEGDKTYGDIKRSMVSFYTNALETYYTKREALLAENPALDLPVFDDSFVNGEMTEDFGGSALTIIILLTLARYDKKMLKHCNFDLEKDKVMEYYLVYELVSSLHKDVFTFAEIIRFANSLL